MYIRIYKQVQAGGKTYSPCRYVYIYKSPLTDNFWCKPPREKTSAALGDAFFSDSKPPLFARGVVCVFPWERIPRGPSGASAVTARCGRRRGAEDGGDDYDDVKDEREPRTRSLSSYIYRGIYTMVLHTHTHTHIELAANSPEAEFKTPERWSPFYPIVAAKWVAVAMVADAGGIRVCVCVSVYCRATLQLLHAVVAKKIYI